SRRQHRESARRRRKASRWSGREWEVRSHACFRDGLDAVARHGSTARRGLREIGPPDAFPASAAIGGLEHAAELLPRPDAGADARVEDAWRKAGSRRARGVSYIA